MNIDKFKQDHVAIFASVTELRKLVQAGIVENSESISKMIVSMSSMIKLHLAAEDRMLYPALVNSSSPAAAQIGKAFQSEMGNIAAAYMTFANKWSFAPRVAAEPEAFRSDANEVFKALHQRIQRENEKLYPMAENI